MQPANPGALFTAHLSDSLTDDTFVRLVLSSPVAPDGAPTSIAGRLIDLQGTAHLSCTWRYPARNETRNLPLDEAVAWVQEALGRDFRSGLLCTTQRDWQFSTDSSGQTRLVRHKPSCPAQPSRAHDEPRRRMLDATAQDWLHGLELTAANGRPRPVMSAKYRQIDRYLELLSHLAKDCGWLGQPDSPAAAPLTLVDMGCGKGYLTFGAWHLFRRVWKRPATVLGIETREGLVNDANRLARQLGAEGLDFAAGRIATAALPRLDALIALHACDTATDDAILRGIAGGAKLIVLAPCCHKQARPHLAHPAPLAPILRHGIMEERMAEWVTDGLRALFLEWAGYETKMFEFVPTEHTPKNLMISAVQRRTPFADPEAQRRIVALKEHFGLHRHPLDSLLERGRTN